MEDQDSAENSSLRETTERAKSAFKTLFTTTVIRQLFLWSLTLVTIRVLEPGDYGVVGLVMSLYPYLGLIASLELSEWIAQRTEFNADEEKAIFTLSLILGSSVAGVACLIAPFVGAFYEAPEVVPIFYWAAFAILLQGLAFLPYSLLRRDLDFKVIAWTGVAVGMLRAIIQLTLALMGFGYWALVAGAITEALLTTCILIKVRGLPRGLSWNFELYKEAFRYGLPATGAVACGIVFATTDDIVVGKFFGVEMLGYYTMAYYVTDLPLTKVNQLLNPLLVPYFGKVRKSPEYLQRMFLMIVKFGVSLHTPVLLGLAAIAPVAVPVVFGDKWIPAVLPLQIMSIAVLFRGIVDKIPPLLLAIDRPNALLTIRAVSAVVMAPGFYILGTTFGIEGVYAAWIFLYPPIVLISLFVLKRVTGITLKRYYLNIRGFFVAGLIMGAAVLSLGCWLSTMFIPMLIILQVMVGIILYVSLLWLLFRRDLVELRLILKEVLSNRSRQMLTESARPKEI